MKIKRLFQPMLWISLAMATVLLALTLFLPGARLIPLTTSAPLWVTGEYSLNGSSLRLPFTEATRFDASRLSRVTVYGHFNREVKPNTQIVMRICNLHVELLINGKTVFSYGDTHPALMRSGGNVWTAFTSDGVLPTDSIELRLSNIYTNEALSSFDDFFANLSAGSEYTVYRAAFASEGLNLLTGIAIFLLGFAMLCVSFYARRLKFPHAEDYAYLSAFVIVSGLWMSINYRLISLIVPYPAFYQSLEMICMALMPVFLMRYMVVLVPPRHRRLCSLAICVELLAAVAGIALQLFGVADLASLTGVLSLLDMAGIGIFIVCLIPGFLDTNDRETHDAILPLFFLFAGALLNIANYFFNWHTNGLFYSVFFLIFALMEMFRLVRALRDNIRHSGEYAKLENELLQSRIAVMLSQIKPHFLFNALNSISALCLTDPIMADQAITSLSNYLRGNIRSLEQNAPVPFEQELDHIKYYVRLEQLRYGDKLRVVYAIDTTDFVVPTLSLQTLVENAIRHGVSPKPEGGLVVVHTERGENCTLVRIIDDGVGFDPDMRGRNADSIGLANAKKRMEVMMNAEFDVQSIPGKGTTVSIRIPDSRKKGQR